jgi:ATP phosphoribosyltransferase
MLTVAISKGRPYDRAIALLNQHGYHPKLVSSDPRCYTYEVETQDHQQIRYVMIAPRDMADYLNRKVIDLAVGYDDTLNHLTAKNYHLKPLLPMMDPTGQARLCLVGRKNVDLKNPANRIVTEYEDAAYQLSSFHVLTDRGVNGTYINSHGTTESLLSNGLADLGIMIVESGHTIGVNDLVVYEEIRKIDLNFWVNADNPRGYELLKKYRPETMDVYIDGIDGSGKDTTINLLKQNRSLKKYVFHNRGHLTQLTLARDDTLPSSLTGIHILLECSPHEALTRCRHRGQPDPKWETPAALSYFHFKYRELAARYGLCLIDTTTTRPERVAELIQAYLTCKDVTHVIPRVDDLTEDQFKALPLVAQGESKTVRSINGRFDVLQMIPSIYSHKKRRAGFIAGSDQERMAMTRQVRRLLAYEEIPHTYWFIGKNYCLVEKLDHPPPRVEVVVKSRWEGTDKYRYVGLEECPSRLTHEKLVGEKHIYPEPYVRFDWRNSNEHAEGDVAMSETLANHLIHVDATKELALRTYRSICRHFAAFGVEIWDVCFFITQEGEKIFGEISQDNARYKKQGTSYDKDEWRTGNSSEDVLEKWNLLTKMVTEYTEKFFQQEYGK